MALFKKADLTTFAEKVIIYFFYIKESPNHFLGFKTPQFHKNLQSAEVASSKNKNSNVSDDNFSPREGRPVKLKVEDSAEAQRIPASERDTEETRSPTNDFKVRCTDKVEDEDTTLHTKTAESMIALSNHSEGELHQKEDYQACKRAQVKALQVESGIGKCQHDGEYNSNEHSVVFFCMFVCLIFDPASDFTIA